MTNHVDERSFSLQSRIDLPRDTAVFITNGATVACSPSIARWMVLTHPAGRNTLDLLKQGRTLEEVLQAATAKFGQEDARAALEEVLAEVLDKGFEAGSPVQPDLTPSPYVTISLNVTNACNLRCITCYRFSGQRDDQEMGDENWFRILQQHSNMGGKVVKIAGGEPLCRGREFVCQAIGQAKTLGMKTLLLSNGTLIDEETAKELGRAGLDRMQISLDGPDPRSNDRIRGKGVFDKVITALERLCRCTAIDLYLAILPVPDLSLDALLTRGREFADQLRDQFGGRVTISVSQGMLEGREVHHDESLPFVLSCRQIQNTMAGPDTTAGHDLWQWEPGRRNLSCGYGRTLGVDPDGSVRACAGGEVVGNAQHEPLDAIIRKLETAALAYTVDQVEGCRECALRYICGGPCRVRPEACPDERKQDVLERLVATNRLRYDRPTDGR